MEKIESFKFDHTKYLAPFIRMAGEWKLQHGDVVQKYDLRFITPNQGSMDTSGMHALEHLLATYIREELPGVIDLSPMGCRTGFYLIVSGERSFAEIKEAMRMACLKVNEAGEIPGADEFSCGNFRDMSLEGAKFYARIFLRSQISKITE